MMAERKVYKSHLAGRGDDIYAALLAAHEGLDEAASHALNARLVLILANLASEPDAVCEAIATARSYADG